MPHGLEFELSADKRDGLGEHTGSDIDGASDERRLALHVTGDGEAGCLTSLWSARVPQKPWIVGWAVFRTLRSGTGWIGCVSLPGAASTRVFRDSTRPLGQDTLGGSGVSRGSGVEVDHAPVRVDGLGHRGWPSSAQGQGC